MGPMSSTNFEENRSHLWIGIGGALLVHACAGLGLIRFNQAYPDLFGRSVPGKPVTEKVFSVFIVSPEEMGVSATDKSADSVSGYIKEQGREADLSAAFKFPSLQLPPGTFERMPVSIGTYDDEGY